MLGRMQSANGGSAVRITWNSMPRELGKAMFALSLCLVIGLVPQAPVWAMIQSHEGEVATTPVREVFPTPPELEPAVAFWSQVFGVWRRHQVVLHDDRDLGVVYRVLSVEGPAGERLTEAQLKWLREQKQQLASELQALQANVAGQQPLSASQQDLLQRIAQGSGQLAGAAERVRAQRGTRERFLQGLEVSGRYDSQFREIFRSQGLPEDLAYLPHVESSFQYGAVSSVGAAGVWQFMPATGRQFLTMTAAIDERFDPIAAARGAARYFALADRELGSWPLNVTSYNHGIGGMRRAKQRFGDDFARIVRWYDAPSFGFASRNFYAEFLAVRRIVQNLEQYFPDGVRYHAPAAVQALVLDKPRNVHDISRATQHSVAALAEYNPAWTTKALKGQSRLPAGVTVWVPTTTVTARASQPAVTPAAKSEFASVTTRRTPSETQTAGRYRVVKGDTLWAIAQRQGISVASLAQINQLDPARPRLKVGQWLTLSAPRGKDKSTPFTHRVTAGDTPFAIAAAYNVRLHDLLSANNMTEQTKIRPGQQLVIPQRP